MQTMDQEQLLREVERKRAELQDLEARAGIKAEALKTSGATEVPAPVQISGADVSEKKSETEALPPLKLSRGPSFQLAELAAVAQQQASASQQVQSPSRLNMASPLTSVTGGPPGFALRLPSGHPVTTTPRPPATGTQFGMGVNPFSVIPSASAAQVPRPPFFSPGSWSSQTFSSNQKGLMSFPSPFGGMSPASNVDASEVAALLQLQGGSKDSGAGGAAFKPPQGKKRGRKPAQDKSEAEDNVDKAELGKRARAKKTLKEEKSNRAGSKNAVAAVATAAATTTVASSSTLPPSLGSLSNLTSTRDANAPPPQVVVPDQPEIISVVKRKGTVIVLKWGSAPLAIERTIRGTAFIPDGFEVETISDRKTWIGQTRVLPQADFALQYRFYLKSDPTKCGAWHKNASKAYRDAFSKLDNVESSQLEHLKSSNGRLIIGVTYGNLQERIRAIFGKEVAELEEQLRMVEGSAAAGLLRKPLVKRQLQAKKVTGQQGDDEEGSAVSTLDPRTVLAVVAAAINQEQQQSQPTSSSSSSSGLVDQGSVPPSTTMASTTELAADVPIEPLSSTTTLNAPALAFSFQRTDDGVLGSEDDGSLSLASPFTDIRTDQVIGGSHEESAVEVPTTALI